MFRTQEHSSHHTLVVSDLSQRCMNRIFNLLYNLYVLQFSVLFHILVQGSTKAARTDTVIADNFKLVRDMVSSCCFYVASSDDTSAPRFLPAYHVTGYIHPTDRLVQPGRCVTLRYHCPIYNLQTIWSPDDINLGDTRVKPWRILRHGDLIY